MALTREDALRMLRLVEDHKAEDEWAYDSEFTTEPTSVLLALAGVLYHKLEKEGLLPVFSDRLDLSEWADVGASWTWDPDVSLVRAALEVSLEDAGWVFPKNMNYVNGNEIGPSDDEHVFWCWDISALDADFAHEFLQAVEDFTGDSLDDEDVDLDRIEEDYSFDLAAFTMYNPYWHEVMDRFLELKEPPEELADEFNCLDRDIKRFETVNAVSDTSRAFLENGHEVVTNFIFPFIQDDGYGEPYIKNPLLYLDVATPLLARELRKRIEEFDEKVRAAV